MASADEILVDDSTPMAEKMKVAGVEVVLDIWPEIWPDWLTFIDAIPEGEQALEKIAAFLFNHMKK